MRHPCSPRAGSRGALLLALLPLTLAAEAAAQAYPERPIRLIAPISAGGGADVAARLLARSLGETLSQHQPAAGMTSRRCRGHRAGGRT